MADYQPADYVWSTGPVYRSTPPLSDARLPSDGELATYETGFARFPNLGARGSFRTWDYIAPGVAVVLGDFNCFAWSVGHTDRWIQGGSVQQMNELYEYYHYRECSQRSAEVELYRIVDAPAVIPGRTLPNGRVLPTRVNTRAVVQHAHRRDYPNLDNTGRGCSSKMADGPLIAHNRLGLEDQRPWGSGSPQIMYGTIYQYWCRTSEHPSNMGKQGNIRVPTGNHPANRIFQYGEGSYPPGHPGDSLGLPPGPGGISGGGAGPSSGNSLSRSRSKNSSSRYARPTSMYRASYPQVGRLRPYDPIPPPSRAAEDSAVRGYKSVVKVAPRLVKEFEAIFRGWQKSWFSGQFGASQDAGDRCNCREFDMLLDMGPSILPLVIYKMLDKHNFTATFLYNALEGDVQFKVDPLDTPNYLILQRQNNLIVEFNQGRMKF